VSLAFILLFGFGFLLLGIFLVRESLTDPREDDLRILSVGGPTLFAAFGAFAIVDSLVHVVRFDRLFTAVYSDHIFISTAWRQWDVPLSRIRSAVRISGDGDYVALQFHSGNGTCDVAVNQSDSAVQDEFVALINRLIADRQS
jgi:hypothetical protein